MNMHLVEHLKKIADFTASNVSKYSHKLFDKEAVVLDGFNRSFQFDRYSCGAQCVYMILNYHGIKLTHEQIAKKIGTDEDGTELKTIRALFNKYGLKCKIIATAKITDLKRSIDAGQPILISTFDESHWSTVYGYSKDALYVADPSFIKNMFVKIPKSKFKKQWDNWMMSVRI